MTTAGCGIGDLVFPYGKLDAENDWGKLAALVLWDMAEEQYAARFGNNGHPAHPAAAEVQRPVVGEAHW